MKNLTLIIPAKYEADSLPIFLDELKGFECQIIIVLSKEDISTEKSINLKDNIRIIHQKKEGYGRALIDGFNASTTEYSCIINADGSMDPKYLNEMLKECKNKDFIFASRYERPGGGSDDDTIVTLIGNKVFSFMGNVLYNLNISDILYTYILGKTESFRNLNLTSDDFRLCVEIPIKAKKRKLIYKCIASYERSRIAGKKKVNAIKDGFLILIGILSFIFKK